MALIKPMAKDALASHNATVGSRLNDHGGPTNQALLVLWQPKRMAGKEGASAEVRLLLHNVLELGCAGG